jgi:hypothetical protein
MSTVRENLTEAFGRFAQGEFEAASDLRWVASSNSPVRRFFEFQVMKGDLYSARWGFDLEFCPKLSGQKLVWKRSLKQAQIDLALDPIDESGDVEAWHSIARSESNRKVAERVVETCWTRALPELEAVATIEQLVALFGRRSGMRFQRFSLSNYVATDICWGLALHALGEAGRAEDHLQNFRTDYGITQEDRLLNKAIEEARAFQGRLS